MKIKVMTYNIQEGGVGRESALIALIQEANPDILLLQEVTVDTPIPAIAHALNAEWVIAPNRSQKRNIALITRFPITTWEASAQFPLFRSLLMATLTIPNERKIAVFGVHLGLVHDLWRWWEIRTILALIHHFLERKAQTGFALLLGDFNAVAPHDAVQFGGVSWFYRLVLLLEFAVAPRCSVRHVLQQGWIDCFRRLHPSEQGFTLPAHHPNARLDYIFASPVLAKQLVHCAPLLAVASDHLPLVAEFEV